MKAVIMMIHLATVLIFLVTVEAYYPGYIPRGPFDTSISAQIGLLKNMGCWRDSRNRAIKGPVAKFYRRPDAINQCAKIAARMGYKAFAVQNGGECFTSRNADKTYRRLGASNACKLDGKGGPWANQVFLVHELYKNLGCWKDNEFRRAIPSADFLIGGNYMWRPDAIQKCAKVARNHGYKVFALQHGGWCASSTDADITYKKYGPSKRCRPNGKGGVFANQVYKMHSKCENKYLLKNLGCWRDTKARAIASIDHMLWGHYKYRWDGFNQCLKLAMKLGHTIFAIQDDGWCSSSLTARYTFSKYGRSNKCSPLGSGGPWANQVYEIVCRD